MKKFISYYLRWTGREQSAGRAFFAAGLRFGYMKKQD